MPLRHIALRGLTVAAIVLNVAIVVGACGCARSSDYNEAEDPTAIVLVKSGTRSALAVVDLERFEVRRVIGLRSQCFSIDADTSRRTVVTAQCGGLDEDTDDACGVFRLGSRKVTYIRLPAPNPLDIAACAGKAYLVHGFVESAGLCVSVVDLKSGTVAKGAEVPLEAQRPERVGSSVVLPVSATPVDEAKSASSLMVLEQSEPVTLSVDFRLSGPVLVRSEEETRVLVVGRAPESVAGGSFRMAAVEPRTGRVISLVNAPWLKTGVEAAGCLTADGITIADATGVDPRNTGHDVVSVDPKTLQPALRRTLAGMPAAVAAWRNFTLVVDGQTGELLMYDRGEVSPRKRLKVSDEPNLVADMVVFDSSDLSGDSMYNPR